MGAEGEVPEGPGPVVAGPGPSGTSPSAPIGPQIFGSRSKDLKNLKVLGPLHLSGRRRGRRGVAHRGAQRQRGGVCAAAGTGRSRTPHSGRARAAPAAPGIFGDARSPFAGRVSRVSRSAPAAPRRHGRDHGSGQKGPREGAPRPPPPPPPAP